MGLQVSRGIRAQAPPESHFRADTAAVGTDLPRISPAEGMSDRRRTSDAGPRAHLYRDPAQTPGGLSDRVSQREERDCHCSAAGKGRNFSGEHFWARGYAVSTVGFELEQVRQYIREQESADGTDGKF